MKDIKLFSSLTTGLQIIIMNKYDTKILTFLSTNVCSKRLFPPSNTICILHITLLTSTYDWSGTLVLANTDIFMAGAVWNQSVLHDFLVSGSCRKEYRYFG